MNLLISLRSEMLKTRRTATFYLTLVSSAIIPFIFLMDALVDGVSDDNRKDPFNAIFAEGSMMLGVLVFPMFIVLMCTMLAQIEYRNNAWKQVFASPQPMQNIFIARFLNVQLLILLFLVLYNVFILITSVVIHFSDPALNMLNQPLNISKVVSKTVNMYVAILALSAIQFWVGLRFKNFIVPIAIGFALWVTGSLMAFEFKSTYAHYFPYSFLPITLLPAKAKLIPTVQLNSVLYMAAVLVLGFLDFSRRKKMN